MKKNDYSISPENALIQLCLKGNTDAQHRLYQKLSAKMFSVCLRFANDYHSAEDLLQDGFIKVFQNLHKFRGDGSFEGWVRRIFVNTSIEAYRKASRMHTIQEQERIDYEYYDESTLDSMLADDLLKLVNQLSPGYKTVFNMYVIEGYSHKEIAEQLDINEGTSKSQLARARYILQKKVAAANKVAVELIS